MVDPKETNQKALLKNKRVLKGTPLYRYANRFAGYFALSLGCAHLSIGYFTYYLDVDEFWIIGGQKQIAEKAVKLGMYDKHDDDTSMRFEFMKQDLKLSPLGNFYSYVCEIKDRVLSKYPENSASAPSESSKVTSPPVPTAVESKKELSSSTSSLPNRPEV